MDLVDITTWASTGSRTIRLSQIFVDALYQVELKELFPVEGDMLEDRWTSESVTKSHSIPRYALANMEETANMLQRFVDIQV